MTRIYDPSQISFCETKTDKYRRYLPNSFLAKLKMTRIYDPSQISFCETKTDFIYFYLTDNSKIAGHFLEALLLSHFDFYTSELDIPIEQIKNLLDDLGLKYDLSPK